MNKFQLLKDGLIVNKIYKTYGNKKVVRDISLSIKRGEIVGRWSEKKKKKKKTATIFQARS